MKRVALIASLLFGLLIPATAFADYSPSLDARWGKSEGRISLSMNYDPDQPIDQMLIGGLNFWLPTGVSLHPPADEIGEEPAVRGEEICAVFGTYSKSEERGITPERIRSQCSNLIAATGSLTVAKNFDLTDTEKLQLTLVEGHEEQWNRTPFYILHIYSPSFEGGRPAPSECYDDCDPDAAGFSQFFYVSVEESDGFSDQSLDLNWTIGTQAALGFGIVLTDIDLKFAGRSYRAGCPTFSHSTGASFDTAGVNRGTEDWTFPNQGHFIVAGPRQACSPFPSRLSVKTPKKKVRVGKKISLAVTLSNNSERNLVNQRVCVLIPKGFTGKRCQVIKSLPNLKARTVRLTVIPTKSYLKKRKERKVRIKVRAVLPQAEILEATVPLKIFKDRRHKS